MTEIWICLLHFSKRAGWGVESDAQLSLSLLRPMARKDIRLTRLQLQLLRSTRLLNMPRTTSSSSSSSSARIGPVDGLQNSSQESSQAQVSLSIGREEVERNTHLKRTGFCLLLA